MPLHTTQGSQLHTAQAMWQPWGGPWASLCVLHPLLRSPAVETWHQAVEPSASMMHLSQHACVTQPDREGAERR